MIRNTIQFFKNIWKFRKVLWHYKTWDYTFQLQIFRESLIHLQDSVKNGIEVEESKLEKVKAMQRCIDTLNNQIEDNYLDQYTLSDINAELVKKVTEIEENEWNELWDVIKGNDTPGSDMRGWWT